MDETQSQSHFFGIFPCSASTTNEELKNSSEPFRRTDLMLHYLRDGDSGRKDLAAGRQSFHYLTILQNESTVSSHPLRFMKSVIKSASALQLSYGTAL